MISKILGITISQNDNKEQKVWIEFEPKKEEGESKDEDAKEEGAEHKQQQTTKDEEEAQASQSLPAD
jgi:hypothetical protein